MVPDDSRSPAILLLGLGNILLQDEGLGVRALERLCARYQLPTEVHPLDGGTLGLDLLPYLEQASHLLIIDAVHIGQSPAGLVRLEGEQMLPALTKKLSAHQVGLRELLAVSQLRNTLPPRLVLWGMEPAGLDWGLDLTPPVAAALDGLVTAVVQELRHWGTSVFSAVPVA